MLKHPHREAHAIAFHQAIRISRMKVYSGVDEQMPIYLQEDARLPQLGFVGKHYKAGGTVLLAINPGGGGDAYKNRIPSDEIHLPAIERFLESEDVDMSRFEEMNDSYIKAASTWRLWNIVGPVIDACGGVAQEYAFINCFPFRTREDKTPHASALRISWSICVEPTLNALEPGRIIALGKGNYKAGWVLSNLYMGTAEKVIIERTRGDCSIAQSAHEELRKLKQSRKNKAIPIVILRKYS